MTGGNFFTDFKHSLNALLFFRRIGDEDMRQSRTEGLRRDGGQDVLLLQEPALQHARRTPRLLWQPGMQINYCHEKHHQKHPKIPKTIHVFLFLEFFIVTF